MISIHPVCVLMEEKPLNGSSLLLFLVSFPVWIIIVSQCLFLLYLHECVLCCRSLEYYSQCRGRGVPDRVWQWDCERARERTHWHSHTKSACTGQSKSNGSQTSFIHDPNAAHVIWCVDVVVLYFRLGEPKRQRPTAGYCVQRVCLQTIFSITVYFCWSPICVYLSVVHRWQSLRGSGSDSS